MAIDQVSTHNTQARSLLISPRVSRERPLLARPIAEVVFLCLARGIIVCAVVVLILLIGDVVLDGLPRWTLSFLTSYPSRKPEQAGVLAGLIGSLYLILLTIIIALPVGLGAAIYLEEYAKKSIFTRIVELCIANLAGVPSVIFGLLGLQLFARILHLDRSLIAGALTLSLLVLPVIIMASREALKTVPRGYREGALALGATRWQMIRTQVIPVALPGVLTGCILAFSRAIGETAPLVALGALAYVAAVPDSLNAPFTALPIQAFNWLSRPQEAFHANAAAAITVLLVVMLVMNAIAVLLRIRFQTRQR